LLTHRQTDRQTNKVWQKHNLLAGGNNDALINALVLVLKKLMHALMSLEKLTSWQH